MKAIILAAGYGSRMYPLAQDMPKCLLTINGETFLARQLRILRRCGVEDITVVAGFHQGEITDLYAKEVSIRYNLHYGVTNNGFSLWVVKDLLDDDFIVLNADVVFTEELIMDLLGNDDTCCIVVDRKTCDREDSKVVVVNDLIVGIGKEIPLDESYGENIGIAKVCGEGVGSLRKALFECMKKSSNQSWVSAFQRLAEAGHAINFILVDSPWIEVDTRKNYRDAKEMFESLDNQVERR